MSIASIRDDLQTGLDIADRLAGITIFPEEHILMAVIGNNVTVCCPVQKRRFGKKHKFAIVVIPLFGESHIAGAFLLIANGIYDSGAMFEFVGMADRDRDTVVLNEFLNRVHTNHIPSNIK